MRKTCICKLHINLELQTFLCPVSTTQDIIKKQSIMLDFLSPKHQFGNAIGTGLCLVCEMSLLYFLFVNLYLQEALLALLLQ